MEQTLIITGIALGIVVNLVAIMALIWKFGSWSGRVTQLLADHSEDHKNHYSITAEHTQAIARLEGQV